MCRYEEWNRETHAMGNCPNNAVSEGLCQEHLEWVQDCAAPVHGFRFEYRAEGGSGFYWNGKRVASTREGLERMGPAILAKVCKV